MLSPAQQRKKYLESENQRARSIHRYSLDQPLFNEGISFPLSNTLGKCSNSWFSNVYRNKDTIAFMAVYFTLK